VIHKHISTRANLDHFREAFHSFLTAFSLLSCRFYPNIFPISHRFLISSSLLSHHFLTSFSLLFPCPFLNATFPLRPHCYFMLPTCFLAAFYLIFTDLPLHSHLFHFFKQLLFLQLQQHFSEVDSEVSRIARKLQDLPARYADSKPTFQSNIQPNSNFNLNFNQPAQSAAAAAAAAAAAVTPAFQIVGHAANAANGVIGANAVGSPTSSVEAHRRCEVQLQTALKSSAPVATLLSQRCDSAVRSALQSLYCRR
jgi:hypothetical protein